MYSKAMRVAIVSYPPTDRSQPSQGSTAELLRQLATDERSGLSSSEAARRLQQYGPNEIVEKKTSHLKAFLRYFWGPIPWMIEAAALISAIIQHWDDLGIILVLLIINAIVGFWQENKASNAIELLKQRLALRAKVLRDGSWKEVAASELVPGDVIRIRLGNIVPADGRLIGEGYLLADQSALTGAARGFSTDNQICSIDGRRGQDGHRRPHSYSSGSIQTRRLARQHSNSLLHSGQT